MPLNLNCANHTSSTEELHDQIYIELIQNKFRIQQKAILQVTITDEFNNVEGCTITTSTTISIVQCVCTYRCVSGVLGLVKRCHG